ncbi:hypothetical protein V6N13_114503 [Hibiscus sabdariffa]
MVQDFMGLGCDFKMDLEKVGANSGDGNELILLPNFPHKQNYWINGQNVPNYRWCENRALLLMGKVEIF